MRNPRIPEGVEWELLVVNNNCTDNTDEVIEKHSSTLPVRRLFEPKQGHCHARNCAVDAAQGEFVVWTDDDVIVDCNWISTYIDAFERHPKVDFFGGTIEPWFEGHPPKWLVETLDCVGSAFAVQDPGDEERDCSSGSLPFGANFAIRTSIQRAHKYDVALGRKGSGMLSGDETAVLNAILTEGHTGRWVPSAKVKHFIPKERQNVGYLRRYYEGHGVLLARRSGCEGTSAPVSVSHVGCGARIRGRNQIPTATHYLSP